jgi:hypothetical protein
MKNPFLIGKGDTRTMFRPKTTTGPITIPYRFLSLLLALVLAGSAFLAFHAVGHAQVATPQVITSPGNPAVSYADSYWNCTDSSCTSTVSAGSAQPNFQCAEFVARALSTEGLIPGLGPNSPRSAYANYVASNGVTYDLLWVGYVTPPDGLKQYLLDNGLATDVGNNPAEAVPGDVVIYPGGDGNGHTALLVQTGTTVDGSDSLVDAHNNARYHVPYEEYSTLTILHIRLGGTRGASQAVSQLNGTVDTFFKGTNGALYHAWYIRGSSWTNASAMSSTAVLGSEPSAVTSSPGVVNVFWKGADSTAQLWHVSYTPGSGWTSAASSLGDGPLGGDPKAVAQADGSIQVFWHGTDNNIWHAWYTPGSGWAGPGKLTTTGNVASDPAPVNSQFDTWDVFWKGSDGNLWHVYQYPGDTGWSTVKLGDGPLGGDPKAIGQSDGSIQVVWRGSDNNIWHAWYTPGSSWAGPGKLTTTGNVTADPAPANSLFGTWDVFWKGSDGHLWHVYQNPGDTGWTTGNLSDGILGGAPVATGQPDGTIDVFWVGTNSAIWHTWYNAGGPWASALSLGGSVV